MKIGPRVLVVGTSGSGKSVLAARLACALGGHLEVVRLRQPGEAKALLSLGG